MLIPNHILTRALGLSASAIRVRLHRGRMRAVLKRKQFTGKRGGTLRTYVDSTEAVLDTPKELVVHGRGLLAFRDPRGRLRRATLAERAKWAAASGVKHCPCEICAAVLTKPAPSVQPIAALHSEDDDRDDYF